MNACLRELARRDRRGFRQALREPGIDAPTYLSQNDGTLMSAEFAERYPVATFASGPTNSMRGAALLSGLDDCAVVDIGGTTSDIGILENGFPREASLEVEIGGVRTNFRMPDVLSIGIGGGSVVTRSRTSSVGPVSVGYELTTRARVFGGDTLTGDRRGRRRRARRDRRPSARPRRAHGGSRRGRARSATGSAMPGPDEDEPRPDPGSARRRR